jgi:hypothetical protein
VDTLDGAIHQFPNRFHDPKVLEPEAGLRSPGARVMDMNGLTRQRGKYDRLSDECPTARVSRAINLDQCSPMSNRSRLSGAKRAGISH